MLEDKCRRAGEGGWKVQRVCNTLRLKGVPKSIMSQISNDVPQKLHSRGFPGGAVVKNLPANAGDMGLIPGPGRSHMPWSN